MGHGWVATPAVCSCRSRREVRYFREYQPRNLGLRTSVNANRPQRGATVAGGSPSFDGHRPAVARIAVSLRVTTP
jgi:hypothetical protein